MKTHYWLVAGIAILATNSSRLIARAEDTNTVEIIKQLQRRIDELEQKVKTLESHRRLDEENVEARVKQRTGELEQKLKSAQREKELEEQAKASKAKGQIQELDQKVKVLERNRELDLEAAEAKEQSAPKITLTEEGFSGFAFATPDKDFSLRLRGYVQGDARFYIGDNIPINDTFLIRRSRIGIEGTFFHDYDYRILLDVGSRASITTGNNSLVQDAWVNAHYWPGFQIQAGKFKPPIGYEHLNSDANLLLLERGYPSQLVPNREVGAQLFGELLGGRLNYAVGVFNGVFDGGSEDFDSTDDHKDVIGRLTTQPFKGSGQTYLEGLSFGIGASFGQQNGALPSFLTAGAQRFFAYANGTGASNSPNVMADGTHWRVNPEIQYTFGPLGIFGEYVVSSQDLQRTQGSTNTVTRAANRAWNITASYILTGEANTLKGVSPRRPFSPNGGGWGAWELAGRVGELALDEDLFPKYAAAGSARSALSFGLGLNWYLNRNLKLNLNYEHTWFEGGSQAAGAVTAQDENAFLTRIQFAF